VRGVDAIPWKASEFSRIRLLSTDTTHNIRHCDSIHKPPEFCGTLVLASMEYSYAYFFGISPNTFSLSRGS
jgi:hypothetical protein